jgi:hypothetical protein
MKAAAVAVNLVGRDAVGRLTLDVSLETVFSPKTARVL